jgi:hypothetical protein
MPIIDNVFSVYNPRFKCNPSYINITSDTAGTIDYTCVAIGVGYIRTITQKKQRKSPKHISNIRERPTITDNPVGRIFGPIMACQIFGNRIFGKDSQILVGTVGFGPFVKTILINFLPHKCQNSANA